MPLGKWDTSNVISTAGMFMNCRNFNQNINNWNVSKLEYANSMFEECWNFNHPLDKWNTSSLISTASMFKHCINFNQNINNWNVSKLEYAHSMFEDCYSFNQPLDKWDTSNLKYISSMFKFCYEFNQPLNTWNTYQIVEMDYVFNKAKNLLTENFIDNSSLDVKLIMLSSLGIKEEELILNFNKDFKKSAFNDFWQKIQRRINGEPVSKIINSRFFWNNKFYVNKDVLDPRPDSEIIIEAVLDDYSNEQELNILDLGTGSGCLILTLLSIFKKSRGLATDINEKSLLIAKKIQILQE